MATLEFKIPIAIAKFPFDYAKASRAILRPELDVVSRAPVSAAGTSDSLDHNILQLLHCENMMPVDTGMLAVGFYRDSAGFGATARMKQMLLGLDTSWISEVGSRVRPGFELGWIATGGGTIPQIATSSAIVNGNRCFVLSSDAFARLWEIAQPFVPTATLVTPTMPSGFFQSGIVSICGAGNYLIAAHIDSATQLESVLWSSITNPLNFNDPTSGSGRAVPNADIGTMHTVRTVLDGFIIFGTRGMIGATATKDATRPFSFRPIPGGYGTQSRYDIPVCTPGSDMYAKTSAGIQRVSLQRADTILPDVWDFLSQTSHSVWSGGVGVVKTTKNLVTLMTYVLNRYLIFSYAGTFSGSTDNSVFTKALIYDLQLQRWGQVNKLHSTVIGETTLLQNVHSRIDRIQFVGLDGTVDTLILDTAFNWTGMPSGSVQPSGIVVVGHVKGTRGRSVTFQQAICDGIDGSVTASILPALVGHARVAPVALTAGSLDGSTSRSWRGRYTADNFDLVLQGKLDLTTILVSVTQHGSR